VDRARTSKNYVVSHLELRGVNTQALPFDWNGGEKGYELQDRRGSCRFVGMEPRERLSGTEGSWISSFQGRFFNQATKEMQDAGNGVFIGEQK